MSDAQIIFDLVELGVIIWAIGYTILALIEHHLPTKKRRWPP